MLFRSVALKANETGWAEFSFPSGDGKKFDKAKSIDLTSIVKVGEETSSATSETTESSSSSSVDCDKFIQDYSDFVDSYIKLLKKYKANPTDASILTEYTEAAQKAAEMQTNASSCTDPKYATKLMELANKIAKAAL